MADLEGSLQKLDRLTQEEARMALAEVLRITHSVSDEVKVVDGKVESVKDKMVDIGDNVADMGDKVEEIGDKVDGMDDKLEGMGVNVEDIGDKVQCIDEKVEVVINGVPRVSSSDGHLTRILSDGQQARIMVQQAANGIDEIKCS